MKTKTIKKVLLYTLGVFTLLVMVLALHIYLVYRPKAPDAYSKIMARIDIKQQLTQNDANKIAAWMYHQKGIDHVLVNPQTNIVVFTFFPIKTTGNQIVDHFKAAFPYKADRFMPSAADLKNGCPAAASSFTYKIYKAISQII
jgi:hypothetical protein